MAYLRAGQTYVLQCLLDRRREKCFYIWLLCTILMSSLKWSSLAIWLYPAQCIQLGVNGVFLHKTSYSPHWGTGLLAKTKTCCSGSNCILKKLTLLKHTRSGKNQKIEKFDHLCLSWFWPVYSWLILIVWSRAANLAKVQVVFFLLWKKFSSNFEIYGHIFHV